MKRILITLTAVLLTVAGAGAWYLHDKQPLRSGELALQHLGAPVQVRYDERGVPHIEAQNEADLYRALGFVQAQDRLFVEQRVEYPGATKASLQPLSDRVHAALFPNIFAKQKRLRVAGHEIGQRRVDLHGQVTRTQRLR